MPYGLAMVLEMDLVINITPAACAQDVMAANVLRRHLDGAKC